ncbi:MAG: hypothetical protein KAT58_09545 [candidate division Zixibacteria bacterium]|nr:hypothetical protein [candidate division Zixibacteria bacterium]
MVGPTCGVHLARWACFWGLVGIVLLAGCGSVATRKGFYEPITSDLRAARYDSAAVKIEIAKEENKYAKKDRFLYYLDAGLAYHYAWQYDLSNERLTAAEQAAEELFTRSISRAATSILLNDNALEYAGEDYEILYTNLVMALNYLSLNDFEDAFVETRRANLRLDLLEQKYADAAQTFQREAHQDSNAVVIPYEVKKVRFNNCAFARYLSMHMYAAAGEFDDAEIDHRFLQEAYLTQPHVYPFDLPDVKYYADKNTILSVVALVGLSPVKEALNLRIRTDKQLNLVQVLYDGPDKGDAEYGHIFLPIKQDYYFKFAIPVIAARLSQVDRVQVRINGEVIGELQLLEDVGLVAQQIFEAKKSLIYIRSVARAVAKGLAAHQLKKKIE